MSFIDIPSILKNLRIEALNPGSSTGQNHFGNGKLIKSFSPIDGQLIGKVTITTKDEYEEIITKSLMAFKNWRMIPTPKRGEVIRQFGNKLRKKKDMLGKLVSYEMGKPLQEGWGEVQEMIDICDFAVGLSRQLYGLTMHSERSSHRMYEQWHPLGIVGIISSFNFPVAVWSWNTAIAWICGDVCIWKPSEKTPLCGIACQKIFAEVLKENDLPEGLCCLVNGGSEVGEWLSNDNRISLISATGSTHMGRKVSEAVSRRLGRSLLELGGNNAIIVTENSDLDIAIISAVFGAVGTAGQRCTSTRRLIVQESVYDDVKKRLIKAYNQLKIGNPLSTTNHIGPLIDTQAVEIYRTALRKIVAEGGKMLVEGDCLKGEEYSNGCYVKPCIAEVQNDYTIVRTETFSPILYLIKYCSINEAIEMQNAVPQGLSSAIMTTSLREVEKFLSHAGSDCGIANVNVGTSGAEIGGAFGGEKETGGGRESGSDSWKNYMRRQTNTINYSTELPLAQGIKFEL